MPWFYFSFADQSQPKGKQFLGACLIEASSIRTAHAISHARGLNPGGEAMILPVDHRYGAPPPDAQHVLMRTREEIEHKTAPWLGDGAKTETLGEREARGGDTSSASFVCSNHNADD